MKTTAEKVQPSQRYFYFTKKYKIINTKVCRHSCTWLAAGKIMNKKKIFLKKGKNFAKLLAMLLIMC